ncbi:MAG: M4 family metallopeptidase [Bacteroidota bacterium]
MKKNYYYSFLFALFITISVTGQVNNKIKDGTAFQRTLKFENGESTDAGITAFMNAYKLGKGNSFQAQTASVDRTGMSHQRQQQFYKGIKVEFGMLITHTLNGKLTSINGELYNASGLNLTPTITKSQGLTKAMISTNATKFLWDDENQASLMGYKKPEGELVVFPLVVTGEVKLAYKYDVYTTQPISRAEIFIDAQNGNVLYKNPIIKHATNLISDKEIKEYAKKVELITTGNAATRYSGARNIETSFDSSISKYVLNDATRGLGINTYNCERTNTRPSTNFVDDDNDWSDGNYATASTTKDNAALDAHWGAEMTYDFWKNIFNRNSFDNNGAIIKSYVHFDDDPSTPAGWYNANWNGSAMTYGDGTNKPLTALDVCGHEIGHAVCTYTANLAYQNQSGGMNEGYSDIWGACIEQYGRNGSLTGPYINKIWQIGEDFTQGGLRNMSLPLAKGNPDTYLGTNWTVTADDGACTPNGNTNDYCGVHNNSGVMNFWFYLVTVGKSGTNNAPVPDNYIVTGIGMAKSAEIAYFAERDYLTANSTFADARLATLAVAGSLYCASSPEFIAVTNAWYAVNVGEEYVGVPDDINLKTVAGNTSVGCNGAFSPSITFENGGSNPITSVDISYAVDGGTATLETWTGNLAVCSSEVYPLNISGLTRGTHTLSVTTTIVNDGVATNNTKSTSITLNDAGVVGVVNPFTTAADGLVSIDEAGTNTVWARGNSTKTQLSNTVAGGSAVYATKLAGKYPDKTKAFLVSQCYDLSSVNTPVVKFNMAYDFETNWDLLYMEYSTDGGTAWSTLGTGTSPTWYTNSRLPNGTDCFNCIGGQWTGEGNLQNPRGDGINAKMREYSYDLSAFGLGGATPASNILFRFVFHSDESAVEEGAIIDNFVVEGTLSSAHNDFNVFSVSPNPSKGTVTLSLSTNSEVKVSLYDISGRNIYNKTYSNSDVTFNQELKFNSLSKGIYLLNVESEGKKASKKLIIE